MSAPEGEKHGAGHYAGLGPYEMRISETDEMCWGWSVARVGDDDMQVMKASGFVVGDIEAAKRRVVEISALLAWLPEGGAARGRGVVMSAPTEDEIGEAAEGLDGLKWLDLVEMLVIARRDRDRLAAEVERLRAVVGHCPKCNDPERDWGDA
jgi:hypothetical protein